MMKSKKNILIAATAAALLLVSTAGADNRDGDVKGVPGKKVIDVQPQQQTVPITVQPQETASGSVSTATGEQINWQVISSGGCMNASTTGYRLSGTIGQTATGLCVSGSHLIQQGFWQNFTSGIVCDCRPGDANFDLTVNLGDAVYLINYVFKSGAEPAPYTICSGDGNGDCLVNLGDAVYLINYVFKDGQSPPECEVWRLDCGPLHK